MNEVKERKGFQFPCYETVKNPTLVQQVKQVVIQNNTRLVGPTVTTSCDLVKLSSNPTSDTILRRALSLTLLDIIAKAILSKIYFLCTSHSLVDLAGLNLPKTGTS